jgi:hypothetical protein
MHVLTPAMVHEVALLVAAIAALLKVIWPKRTGR